MNTISLKDLCLKFPIYDSKRLSLRNTILDKLVGGNIEKKEKEFPMVNALKNINLEARPGDRIGLIGHNGSGKSTLLRVLAGIYPPSSGNIDVKGTISTLFGTAIGINEDMTGYENIFLSSLILSKNYKRSKENLSEIAEFTELNEYLKLPIRTYSDGMRMRIGFSVATNMQPDILLIDEVFGAGDKDFSEKANNRIISLIEKSSILFLASHSDDLIRKFCNKAMLLSRGEVIEFGKVDSVLSIYHSNSY